MINKLLLKLRNMPESLKATLVFAISSFATSGINYITTPIFTRILTSAQYGVVSVYNSWYAIIRIFASMTLIFPGVLNVGLYEHKDDRWGYLSSMLGLTTVATMILSVGYALFSKQVEGLLALPSSLITLILIMCLFQPATTFWTYKQRYEYRYKITFVVSVGSAVLAQIVSIVAVLLFERYDFEQLDQVRLWSAGIVNTVVALVLYGIICKKGGQFVNISLWKKTAVVAIPLIPHYLGSELLSSLDKIMISRMVSDEKAGIYSIATILSSVGVLLWRALNIMYAPFVNEKLGKRDFKSIQKNVKPLLQMVAIMCIIAALAAPEIVGILATDDYMEGIYAVPPIVAGIFAHALYDVFSAVSFFHKKSINITIATVVAAVVNIVLNYLCIKQYGYIAAGYTTLISNLALVLMHYWNIRKIEKERVYDGKFSAYIMMLVVLGCLVCSLLYRFIVIRYILILALLLIAYLWRAKLVNALVDMKI